MRIGLVALAPLASLVLTPAVPAGEAPYPPSQVISGIVWDLTHTQDAYESDGWAVTWADDDRLYTAYSDGWGFHYPPDCPQESSKKSTAWAVIDGEATAYTACNIASNNETVGDGPTGKKAHGLLSIDGVLYLGMRNANQAGEECEIWMSTDKAVNWTDAGWNFTELGLCALLNDGQDYDGAKDGYVYLYSPDSPSGYNEADSVVLLRAPKDQLMIEAAWRYFAGLDAGEPLWSADPADRVPVFEFVGGCNRVHVVYYAPLRRYLMTMRARNRLSAHPNHFSIYDAPKPWGPWTTVYYTESALPGSDMSPIDKSRGAWGENNHIPLKWVSDDGRRFYMIYSGDDRFTVRGATIEVRLVTELRFADESMADWNAADGESVTYDVVRSGDATDFLTGDASCVATDTPDTWATDTELPAPGLPFFYLVRAMRAGGSDPGPLGPDGDGNPRQARSCP
ncbi:MAG TPA: hypothetical protein VD788_02415 [Candidatus Polarisedimenticolaceae bacterium]|nr:hypothetical protein [Candidatus Polarisedimenticolaceae bacterium]